MIEESIERMLERLKPSGWHDSLEYIIDSTAFRMVMAKLIRDVDLQYQFYPKMMHWFRMFEECPFHVTRAAIMTGLPPRYWKMAVGIPYNTLEGRKSIVHEWFERDIRETLGDRLYVVPTDMTKWTNQGLLLLPCGLTNGHGNHIELWKPIMVEIMDMLSHRFPDIPWVLMGRPGKWFEEFVKGEVLFRQQPLNSRNVPWKGDGMFKKINEILHAQGKDDFIW
jgi:uracil DNA glycosylase